MKSIPSLACFSMDWNMMSSSIYMAAPFSRMVSMAAWYTGTLPTGMSDNFRILLLISSKSPPTESSIKVSALLAMATLAFSSSISKSHISVEVPIVALTFVRSPAPIPTAFTSLPLLLGMAMVPWATDLLMNSASTFSFSATAFISSVIMPFLASSICVIDSPCVILSCKLS